MSSYGPRGSDLAKPNAKLDLLQEIRALRWTIVRFNRLSDILLNRLKELELEHDEVRRRVLGFMTQWNSHCQKLKNTAAHMIEVYPDDQSTSLDPLCTIGYPGDLLTSHMFCDKEWYIYIPFPAAHSYPTSHANFSKDDCCFLLPQLKCLYLS
ncbi:hypothetical protein BGZ63DRAFT_172821 [Mariannaea sp. PMI_226]|nr:hypothetical protein BGZ63DRAFT_172821 [Mariannaea sp. PMI_226]